MATMKIYEMASFYEFGNVDLCESVSSDNHIIPLHYVQLGNNCITWCSLPAEEVEPLTLDGNTAVSVPQLMYILGKTV